MKRWIHVLVSSALAVGGVVFGADVEPVMISDFSTCTPQSALTTTPEWDHWQTIEYEADGVSGTMIGAKSLIEPPAVSLPLTVQGWHKIYVGIWNPYFEYSDPAEDDFTMVLRLKLSGDPTFHRIQENNPGSPAEQTQPQPPSLSDTGGRKISRART